MTTVLVIEDDATARKLISAALALDGRRVIAAGSGEEGIALARVDPPVIALIDIRLPGIDGITAAAQLRRNLRPKRIKLVAMTAGGNDALSGGVQRAGFDALLPKPFLVQELRAVIDQLLRSVEP